MHSLISRLMAAIKSRRATITIVGDTMRDRWVIGNLAPCQDGCLKHIRSRVVEVPGGAANVARCLSHWDVRVSLHGFAENDCPIKTRYVTPGGAIVFRADSDGPASRGDAYGWARDAALEMVPHSGAVLLSDYDKGFLTPEYINNIATKCKERGIPCVADCKRAPELYAGCILKGNHNYSVAKCYQCDVVTCGGDPPIVQHEGIYAPSAMPPVKCVNHVGAGDCFGAHLTLALACGFSLKEAATIAHSAGRAYVQHPYNRPPYPSDISADLCSAEAAVISTSTP